MAETSNELISAKMILKALQCPACQHELQPPIYHCSTGHAICSRCLLKRRKKCPACDLPVGTTPSLALQSFIQSIHVPCAYSSFGCDRDSIPLKDKAAHEQECSFGPCHCPVESCDYKCFPLLLSAHIKKVHPEAGGRGFAYNRRLTVYLKQEDDFIFLFGSDDQVFLLLKERYRTFATGFKMTVVCLMPESQEKSYWYELSVRGDGHKVLLLKVKLTFSFLAEDSSRRLSSRMGNEGGSRTKRMPGSRTKEMRWFSNRRRRFSNGEFPIQHLLH